MPEIVAGEEDLAVARDRARRGLRRQGHPHHRAARRRQLSANGAKMFITNGVHADLYCVAAKTGAAGGRRKRISMFLVEKGAPGFRVGRALDKHGWRSSDTAELLFEDCRVPAANLLGEEGRGFYAIMRNFQNERIVIGAMAMGEAQAAIELTMDWVKHAPGVRRAVVVQAGDPAAAGDAGGRRSRPGGSWSITPPGVSAGASTSPARSRWSRPIAANSSTR